MPSLALIGNDYSTMISPSYARERADYIFATAFEFTARFISGVFIRGVHFHIALTIHISQCLGVLMITRARAVSIY